MKMSELAASLLECLKHGAADAEVKAFDPESSSWEVVTSFTYGGEECNLYTDED